MSRPDRRGFVLLFAMLALALAGALVLTAHALATRELAVARAWQQSTRLLLSAESGLEQALADWPGPWHDPTSTWPPLPDSIAPIRIRLTARRVGESVLDLEAVASPAPGPSGPARRAGLLVHPVLRNDSVVAAHPIPGSAWRELLPPRR